MPSSTPVTAGDPIKASQYNSLITDMTTLDTDLTADMTALETSVNNSIANLEAQTELLLLNTKVTLKTLNWVISSQNYSYYAQNTSAVYQHYNLMDMRSYEGNGSNSWVAAFDGVGTAEGTSSWVWDVSTSINGSATMPFYWGIGQNNVWDNFTNGVTGIESNAPYGYTIFRYNPDDNKLYAVTRASSADTEEVEDLGLASSINGYMSGNSQVHMKIHKDNFSPTPGVKYYINGVLVASHLHANGSGNNQYNNFASGAWDMGVGSCNRGNTKPSSGTNQLSIFVNPMNCATLTNIKELLWLSTQILLMKIFYI